MSGANQREVARTLLPLALLVLLLQTIAPSMVLARMAAQVGAAGSSGLCITLSPDDDDGSAVPNHNACPVCALRTDAMAVPILPAAPVPVIAASASKAPAAYTLAQPRAPPRETAQPRAPPSLS